MCFIYHIRFGLKKKSRGGEGQKTSTSSHLQNWWLYLFSFMQPYARTWQGKEFSTLWKGYTMLVHTCIIQATCWKGTFQALLSELWFNRCRLPVCPHLSSVLCYVWRGPTHPWLPQPWGFLWHLVNRNPWRKTGNFRRGGIVVFVPLSSCFRAISSSDCASSEISVHRGQPIPSWSQPVRWTWLLDLE